MRGFVCSLLLCAVLAGACTPAPAPADRVVLAQCPRDYQLRDVERRYGWRVSGGTRKELSLSLPSFTQGTPKDVALRLGVLPKNRLDAHVDVSIRMGNKRVTSYRVDTRNAWTDRRIPLDAAALAKAPCTVTFESARDFWVGPCEIVTGVQSKPDVLIVLLDALRADHLGCYGYARATSPEIDALARDSVRCMHAIAQASWTRPSVASLFTSTYPSTHGAVDRHLMMRPGLPTLGQSLRTAGYETYAFMTNPLCLPLWGIGTEFDRCLELIGEHYKRDDRVLDMVADWLEYTAGHPSFVYVHLVGTHNPYTAISPFDARFDSPNPDTRQKTIDEYDEGIAFSDAQVGELLRGLREKGRYDNTLIVLMADHGEQIYEHGVWGHGQSLYTEELRVPLLVKLPGSAHAGTRCDDLLEVIDIAPTILEAVGLPPEPRFQGTSFLPSVRGEGPKQKTAYASLYLEEKSMYMSQTLDAKYMHDLVKPEQVWFNLVEDPGEQHPLNQPFPEAEKLETYASKATAMGAAGLNVLITPGNEGVNIVSGSVRGAGMGQPSIRYTKSLSDVECDGNTASFSIRFGEGRKFSMDAAYWFDKVEQDSAHLHVATNPNAEIVLELAVDGKPLPPSEILLKEPGGSHPMSGSAFTPVPLADDPQLDPLILPRRFAVYVWYVPSAENIGDEALSPEVRERLQGLGYLK